MISSQFAQAFPHRYNFSNLDTRATNNLLRNAGRKIYKWESHFQHFCTSGTQSKLEFQQQTG